MGRPVSGGNALFNVEVDLRSVIDNHPGVVRPGTNTGLPVLPPVTAIRRAAGEYEGTSLPLDHP